MELSIDALQQLPEQEQSGLQPCSETCKGTCNGWTCFITEW